MNTPGVGFKSTSGGRGGPPLRVDAAPVFTHLEKEDYFRRLLFLARRVGDARVVVVVPSRARHRRSLLARAA